MTVHEKRCIEVVTRAADILGGMINAVKWMNSTPPIMGGKRPIDIITTKKGYELITYSLNCLEGNTCA